METLGPYIYPNLGTFMEAQKIAYNASLREGVISNVKAARLIGHSVAEGRSLSGALYKKFDDLCSFGLFERERGTLKLTSIGEEALSKDDFEKSHNAKIKAIRNIAIIGNAFDAWNGVLPLADSFQEKLSVLTGTTYTECNKHVTHLQRLFQETFPILSGTTGIMSPDDSLEASKLAIHQNVVDDFARDGRLLIGELRTRIGVVLITDGATLELAIKHLEVLKKQVKDAYLTETKSPDDVSAA